MIIWLWKIFDTERGVYRSLILAIVDEGPHHASVMTAETMNDYNRIMMLPMLVELSECIVDGSALTAG